MSERIASALRQLPVPHHVLELGCGSDPVQVTFSGRFIGLDYDSAALVKKRNMNPSALFIAADIAQMPIAQRSQYFDMVVIRHPDLDRNRWGWQQAIETACILLTIGGYLVITNYSVAETETIRLWLQHKPLQPTPLDSLAPPTLWGRDRFISIRTKVGT